MKMNNFCLDKIREHEYKMKIFVIIWLSHVRKSAENFYFTIDLFEQKNFFSWPQYIIWCYSNILIEHQPFSTSHSDWVNSTMIYNRGILMKFLPKVPNFLRKHFESPDGTFLAGTNDSYRHWLKF